MQRILYLPLLNGHSRSFKIIHFRVSERQMVQCNNFGFVSEGSEAVVTKNNENRAKSDTQNRRDIQSTQTVESI